MKDFINPYKKGTDLYGVMEHLRHYKTVTVRELSIPPYNSNRPNKLIQLIRKHFENSHEGIALTFEWKRNPETKRNFKEFFLREVA